MLHNEKETAANIKSLSSIINSGSQIAICSYDNLVMGIYIVIYAVW